MTHVTGALSVTWYLMAHAPRSTITNMIFYWDLTCSWRSTISYIATHMLQEQYQLHTKVAHDLGALSDTHWDLHAFIWSTGANQQHDIRWPMLEEHHQIYILKSHMPLALEHYQLQDEVTHESCYRNSIRYMISGDSCFHQVEAPSDTYWGLTCSWGTISYSMRWRILQEHYHISSTCYQMAHASGAPPDVEISHAPGALSATSWGDSYYKSTVSYMISEESCFRSTARYWDLTCYLWGDLYYRGIINYMVSDDSRLSCNMVNTFRSGDE